MAITAKDLLISEEMAENGSQSTHNALFTRRNDNLGLIGGRGIRCVHVLPGHLPKKP